MPNRHAELDPNAPPVNPLPWPVLGLAGIMFVIELAFMLGAEGIIGGAQAVGWRLAAMQEYAFSDTAFNWMFETGRYPLDVLQRFVTYSFVHFSFTHALFAIVILLAIGKAVGNVLSPVAILLVFFGASIGGAALYGAVYDTRQALAGAYTGDYGLIGAFTYLLMVNLAAAGANKYQAFTFIGMLMGIRMLFALVFGGSPDWIADVAGFAIGFGLTIFLAPGGWNLFLAQIRRR
ncbi:MAG: rhomboid family intramembrane serine protease [Halocynthiibacter sp.]